jgi:hypothetical protein
LLKQFIESLTKFYTHLVLTNSSHSRHPSRLKLLIRARHAGLAQPISDWDTFADICPHVH